MKRIQPDWSPPDKKPGVEYPLKLYNSLTNCKETFIPQHGNKVLWYSCGPTVYDASHMGHARSYISFDIMRRVLQDYFKYNICYVMNITDIDDKIIKRARQNYLFENYQKEHHSIDRIRTDVSTAFERTKLKHTKETDPDKKAMLEREIHKIELVLNNCSLSSSELLSTCRDALSDWLDSNLGATVNDNAIFDDLPNYWENEFHKDMNSLNILPADVLTRVREFIPEIIDYVQKIIDNGFAYESNGSVYFDTAHFSSSDSHFYAKLIPSAFGDQAMLQEGEGDLSKGMDSEKRSPNDFALWKASKAGEPSWPSPWGKGRPGWHIECSVMASSILGESLDIHTGGIDLKFPHHDNEMAQAEAYYGHSHWVRYFLHSGHLTIDGCKMSKSLKNFITIRQALESYSWRQLRLSFLLHSWKDPLDYSRGSMIEAVVYEKLISDYFFIVNYYVDLVKLGHLKFDSSNDVHDVNLRNRFLDTRNKAHRALCDSIDTREALVAIRDLISDCFSYVQDKEKSGSAVSPTILKDIALYISRLMRIFGASKGDPDQEYIGFDTLSDELVKHTASSVIQSMAVFAAGILKEANTLNAAEVIALVEEMRDDYRKSYSTDLLSTGTDLKISANIDKLLRSVATWRQKVRELAIKMKLKPVLKECDRLRDELLPECGVRLEDKEGSTPSAISLMDKQLYFQEKELRKIQAEEMQKEKEAKKREKEEEMKISPQEMFRVQTDKYSQFDEEGVPTHNASGQELSKSQIKTLKKQHKAQAKKHSEYLKLFGKCQNVPNGSS